jgi:hypothetical protein
VTLLGEMAEPTAAFSGSALTRIMQAWQSQPLLEISWNP